MTHHVNLESPGQQHTWLIWITLYNSTLDEEATTLANSSHHEVYGLIAIYYVIVFMWFYVYIWLYSNTFITRLLSLLVTWSCWLAPWSLPLVWIMLRCFVMLRGDHLEWLRHLRIQGVKTPSSMDPNIDSKMCRHYQRHNYENPRHSATALYLQLFTYIYDAFILQLHPWWSHFFDGALTNCGSWIWGDLWNGNQKTTGTTRTCTFP